MKKIIRLIIFLGIYLSILYTSSYAATLAAGSEWYKGSIEKNTITKITFTNTYTVTGEEETWNADEGNTGAIKCYLTGTEITIVDDGTGIKANADSSSLFEDFRILTTISGLDILDTSEVTDMSYMFSSCNKLTSVNLSKFDTSQVTDMSYMFSSCDFTSLSLNHFDTSKVTNMSNMFASCSELKRLSINKFNTSKVTNMQSMFRGLFKLSTLNISNFDTSNVTDMSLMFAYSYGLESLDLSNFDTSNVTNMDTMFYYSYELTGLDLSNFNTNKVTNMRSMFELCRGLTSLDVSSFDTSNVERMTSMFNSCQKIKSLDLSSFDTSKVTYMGSMFNGMSSLEDITVGEKFAFDCELPNSKGDNWYAEDGTAYLYNNMPDNVATTYYAVDPGKEIIVICGEGGIIPLDGMVVNNGVVSVNQGTDFIFQIIPLEGYHIGELLIDGETKTVNDIKGDSYTLENISDNHTIEVTFAECLESVKYDETNHWDACSICNKELAEGSEHLLSYSQKDTEYHIKECTVCEYNADVKHTYNGYKNNETKHWQVCKLCGYSSTEEVHELDWEFDWDSQTHRQECEICEYKTESEEHTLIWKEHDGYHWRHCDICGHTEVSRPHKFSFTSKDEMIHTYTCSECSFVSNEEHTYGDYEKDETEHWKMCTRCGHVTQKVNHTGGRATSTEKAVCEACGTIYGGFLYTVTFMPNGGSGWMEQFFPEGVEQSLAVNTFRRDGYDFLGWATSPSGNVEYSQGAKLILTKDITIYAIWKRQVVNTPAGGGGGGGGSSEKEDEEEIEEYTINASAGKGGSISPSGNVKVKEGKNKTFKITPDKGYKISDVLIDGKSIGVVKSYTFTEVDDKHSIEVVFVNEQTETKPGDVIVVVGNKNNFKEVLFPAKQLLKINNLDGTVKCSDEVATLSIKKNIVRFNNGEAGISIGDKKVILTKPIKILKNEVYITLGDFMQLLEW